MRSLSPAQSVSINNQYPIALALQSDQLCSILAGVQPQQTHFAGANPNAACNYAAPATAGCSETSPLLGGGDREMCRREGAELTELQTKLLGRPCVHWL